MEIVKESVYSSVLDRSIEEFVLINDNGLQLKMSSYGCTMMYLRFENDGNNSRKLLVELPTIDDYVNQNIWLNCIVGRYANRIAGASFSLDGTTYTLSQNNGPNCLHGGPEGLHTKVWQGKVIQGEDRVGVAFQCDSPHMEGGFPGAIQVTATFTLDNNNNIAIEYSAVSGKKTVLSLTHHGYFNLDGSGYALDHKLWIDAEAYVAVDNESIPTHLTQVDDTPFDFREMKTIGRDASNDFQGYDHCYVLDTKEMASPIARAQSSDERVVMEVFTTEPGVQFYMTDSLTDKFSVPGAFCLETQHFPDSPNREDFPSVVLEAGEKYESKTTYHFKFKN